MSGILAHKFSRTTSKVIASILIAIGGIPILVMLLSTDWDNSWSTLVIFLIPIPMLPVFVGMKILFEKELPAGLPIESPNIISDSVVASVPDIQPKIINNAQPTVSQDKPIIPPTNEQPPPAIVQSRQSKKLKSH